jgi:hypothetical protein
MKKIAFAFIAAMAVLSFAGCKKKDAAKEAMAKMESFKNDMCKCKEGDKACAEKVEKAMKDYGESMKGKGDGKEPKMSDEDTKKIMATMTEMAKCQQKAMGTGMADPAAGGTPPATPPAGGEMKAPEGGSAAPAAPPAGGEPPKDPAAAPAAGGDMKKEEPKK